MRIRFPQDTSTIILCTGSLDTTILGLSGMDTTTRGGGDGTVTEAATVLTIVAADTIRLDTDLM